MQQCSLFFLRRSEHGHNSGARSRGRTQRRVLFFALSVFAFCSFVAVAHSEDSSPAATGTVQPGNPGQGQQLFQKTCVECHGVEAQGIPHMGMDLRNNDFVAKNTVADVIKYIRSGHGPTRQFPSGMPPGGFSPDATDQQLADIVAWLKSLQPHSR
jgi:mono/diheme cytochrome c family protein